MDDHGRYWPPRLVAKVLGTGRLPDAFVGDGSARFQSARTHPGAAVVDSSLGGGYTSPTRPSLLGETWRDRESSHRGQEHSDFSAWAGAETLAEAAILGSGDIGRGVG